MPPPDDRSDDEVLAELKAMGRALDAEARKPPPLTAEQMERIALGLINRSIVGDMPASIARNAASTAAPPAPAAPRGRAASPPEPGGPDRDKDPAVEKLKEINETLRKGLGDGSWLRKQQEQERAQKDNAVLQRDAARQSRESRPGHVGAVPGGGVLGAVKGLGGMLGAAFGAIIPPLNLLHNVLSSNLSGVNLVMQTFKLLGAVLAPVLLPVMFLMAAGMLYLSDVVWKELKPTLVELYQFVATRVVPVFRSLAEAVQSLIDFIRTVTGNKTEEQKAREKKEGEAAQGRRNETVGRAVGAMAFLEAVNKGKTAEEAAAASRAAGGAARGELDRGTGVARPRGDPLGRAREFAFGEKGGGGPGGGRAGGPSFGAAMKDMLKLFDMQNGRPAQFQGLAGVQSAAVLAALNQDPIQERMEKMTREIRDMLARIVEADDRKGEFAKGGG
jgi:hypothetical protein